MPADRPDEVEPARALGSALRDLQRRSGRTLRVLEESLRISDSSLSRYFCGSTVPPWSTVDELCKALGGDPVEFRHLWEAADRSQRRPTQAAGRTGPRDAAPAPPAVAEEDAADDAPSGPAPSRRPSLPLLPSLPSLPSLPGGRGAWAVVGAVLGLLLGVGGVFLLRPAAPSPGDGVPSGAHGATAAGPDDRIFVSRSTGACLDDSLDHGTRSYPCNGMPYQRWNVRITADGGARLRNHATGECLEHGADGLRTAPCGPAAAQRWTVRAGADAAFEVRSTATHRCLDDSPEGLRMLSCDRSVRQKWA
ncbi:helix-turn-helix domain-containing protein [Streptomyces sp. NPDC007818]|uniref:helix-turn-helix domain-containing protein n=1 Tax=Streptomyces sp. NPDC007818 TaxID=3364780 RepID=UPI0036CAB43F